MTIGGNGGSCFRFILFEGLWLMRIDKFLKISRIIKRRTVANEACDGGRVSVNGKTVKASYDVKPGDVIEIAFGAKTVRARVEQLAEHMPKDGAAGMYTLLE